MNYNNECVSVICLLLISWQMLEVYVLILSQSVGTPPFT